MTPKRERGLMRNDKIESTRSLSDSGAPKAEHSVAVDVAADLRNSMRALFDGLPGSPSRPTEISRLIGVSRVMVSRTASSIKKETPIETLTSIPGPESLRSMVTGALELGVPKETSQIALEAIDGFDRLIRQHFGTRSALNAALSTQNAEALERFEQASRYEVFKGMGKVLGVEAETWLNSMTLVPNADDPASVDVTSVHGMVGLHRLRPDMPIHLSFGLPPMLATEAQETNHIELDLSPYYQNKPTPIESNHLNGQLIHSLAAMDTDKSAKYDMLAVSHSPKMSYRYATETRTKRGVCVIPDIPVGNLVADVLLHGDLFDGIEPDFYVYNMNARGGARPDDRSRDIDLIPSQATRAIRKLGTGLDALTLSEIPTYQSMIKQVHAQLGYDTEEFRHYRLQIPYPVTGFQYVIAFEVQPKPGSEPG